MSLPAADRRRKPGCSNSSLFAKILRSAGASPAEAPVLCSGSFL
jgi:hypothetical protein